MAGLRHRVREEAEEVHAAEGIFCCSLFQDAVIGVRAQLFKFLKAMWPFAELKSTCGCVCLLFKCLQNVLLICV